MRVGLIGVGRIGAAHAAVVRDHPLVTELVVGDADHERAIAIADGLGVASAAVSDLPDDVDALMITAATDAHPGLILRGVAAGIPVFCEKPIAGDLQSTRKVLEVVESVGAAVQIGFQRRFDHGYATARAAVQSGRLGQLRRIHVVTADQEPPHASYIPRSGGIWRDCHVHDFDIIRWVTGREIADIYAIGANRGAAFFAAAGDVDESAAVLRLDDDTLVTLQGSRYNRAGHDVRMEIAGDRDTWAVGLSARTPLTSAEQGVTFPDADPFPDFWTRFLPAYRAEVQAFIEFAGGRRDNPCSVADAVEAFYVAEAATLSRSEGRLVSVQEVRTSSTG